MILLGTDCVIATPAKAGEAIQGRLRNASQPLDRFVATRLAMTANEPSAINDGERC